MSHRSLARQIAINNHVAEIPMLKHLVRQKVQNRRLLAVTIRATNPQNLLLRALRARYEIRADRPRRIIQASLGLLCLLDRRRTVPSIIEHSNRHLEFCSTHKNEAPACVENLTRKHLGWANPGSRFLYIRPVAGRRDCETALFGLGGQPCFSVRRMPAGARVSSLGVAYFIGHGVQGHPKEGGLTRAFENDHCGVGRGIGRRM